jgi:hypothetical protein
MFVKFDPESCETTQRTLNDHYSLIASMELHGGVPDDVRSYFESVKTLVLYG